MDDEFDVPIEREERKEEMKTSTKTKLETPFFLNRIDSVPISSTKLIEGGDKDELDNEYTRLF